MTGDCRNVASNKQETPAMGIDRGRIDRETRRA